MKKINNKHRLGVWIEENTYTDLHRVCNTNRLLTGRLTPGVIVEIGLNLFFKELEKRPLEDIAVEYLTNGNAPGGVKVE